MPDFSKGNFNPKQTKFVRFVLNENPNKLGRKTVEEVRNERVRFNQNIENEKKLQARANLEKQKEEKKDEKKEDYFSSLAKFHRHKEL